MFDLKLIRECRRCAKDVSVPSRNRKHSSMGTVDFKGIKYYLDTKDNTALAFICTDGRSRYKVLDHLEYAADLSEHSKDPNYEKPKPKNTEGYEFICDKECYEQIFRLADIEEGVYEVTHVYVLAIENWDWITLPETIQDVIVDNIDDRYWQNGYWTEGKVVRWSSRYGGFSSSSKHIIWEDGSLYDSKKTRLICHCPYSNESVLELPDTVKEIDPCAFPLMDRLKKLIIPKNIKSFDSNVHILSDVEEVVFKGKLTELTDGKRGKVNKYRINNESCKVKINSDNPYSAKYIFAPTVKPSVDENGIHLTAARADVIGNRAYHHNGERIWASRITINPRFIAYAAEATFDCYEEHHGTEIFLLGEGLEKLLDREFPIPTVYVYEDYETVLDLLNKARGLSLGISEEK